MVHVFAVESVVWSYHEYKDIGMLQLMEGSFLVKENRVT